MEEPSRQVAVALLFTDIVGSTSKWEAAPGKMRTALAMHDALLAKVIAGRGGTVLKHTGDGMIGRFDRPDAAIGAALEAQHLLAVEGFAPVGGLMVRMGVHSGTAEERAGDLFGPTLNRCARVVDAANGGQILLTDAARASLCESASIASDLALVDLGPQRLRGLARPERLWTVVHPDLPAALLPPRSLNATTGNLPAGLAALVGRDELLGELCDLLDGTDLVTLVGPGGVGKTSLALHAGARVAGRLPDGVWIVDLAALTDAGEVAGAVASTLGLADRKGQSTVETLSDALGVREALVVLDNAEHVRAGVADLVQSVRRPRCASRFLSTSQVAIGVPGETIVEVPTLPVLSDADRTGDRSPAVRLFAERAGAADPSFRLDEETAEQVALICAHLDGLPLAIELAAARAEVLPVDRIAAGLARRFELLAAAPGSPVQARHATMAAALDWSVGLLSGATRQRFVRLGAFRAGFGLDAAVSVAGDGAGELEVAGCLAELRRHSLLGVERHGGTPRYRMLETVRAYALEQLTATDRAQEIFDRHARHFVAAARRMAGNLDGPGGQGSIDACELDLPDHRQAFEHLLGTDPRAAATLVSDLRQWWTVRDSPRVGLRWAGEALAALGGDAAEPSEELVGLLVTAGTFASIAGDHADGDRYLLAALEVSETLAIRPPAYALAMLATSIAFRGDREAALGWAQRAREAGGDPAALLGVERFLGATLSLLGDGDTGFAMCQRAVAAARQSPLWLPNALVNLALAGVYLGTGAALDVALEAATEAVAAARRIGSRYYEGGAWGALFGVHRLRGDRRSALEAAVEGMALMLAAGSVRYLLILLDALADDLVAARPDAAVTVASAAAGRQGGSGASGTRDEVVRQRMEARVGERLDPAGFEAAWREGRRLSLDEVVLLARSVAEEAAAY